MSGETRECRINGATGVSDIAGGASRAEVEHCGKQLRYNWARTACRFSDFSVSDFIRSAPAFLPLPRGVTVHVAHPIRSIQLFGVAPISQLQASINVKTRPQLLSSGSFALGYDADGTIVLKQCGPHLFNARASGFAQGSHDLVPGEFGTLQSFWVKLAVVD